MFEHAWEIDLEPVHEQIRHGICLELLVALLETDKALTRQMRTGWILGQFMDAVIQTLKEDLFRLQQDLKESGVEILSVTQDELGRTVRFTAFGQVMEHRFLNELIRVECDELLRMVLGLK